MLGDTATWSPEDLIAYQLGWRGRWSNDTMLSASVFYNDYDRLILFQPAAARHRHAGTGFLAPRRSRPSTAARLIRMARSSRECGNRCRAGACSAKSPTWICTYCPRRLPLAQEASADRTAQVQATLRSNFDLGSSWEIGVGLRYRRQLASLERETATWERTCAWPKN